MPRAIVIGNGSLLAAFDQQNLLCDLYFPYVGMEGQIAYQHRHLIGIYTAPHFSWIHEHAWEHSVSYFMETLVTNSTAINRELELEINFNDFVYPSENVLIRKITVRNKSAHQRFLKLFFSQDFSLYGDKQQDTAFYEPFLKAIVHYRKKRYFLMSGAADEVGISGYATGKSEYQGMEGTWRDAEDGFLGGNPIDQGSVDSTVQFNLTIEGWSAKIMYFWICAGTNLEEVSRLHNFILEETPAKLQRNTMNYWMSWVNKEAHHELAMGSPLLNEKLKQSLLIMRTQIDNHGAIIAANDSDIMKFNKDTYSYMWPRDGAWVTLALDHAWYGEIGQRFFRFCAKVITAKWYLLHKYNPDLSVGSSWHPWFKNGEIQIPIQEDETAIVLYALYQHYLKFGEIEFVQEMYGSLIRNGGNFLMDFIDQETGLPLPSYDLWEKERGVFAYTCATVYAGLDAASKLSQISGHFNHFRRYEQAAQKIRDAILQHFFDPALGRFVKAAHFNPGTKIFTKDETIDASLHGLWLLGVLPADDPRIQKTNQCIWQKLHLPTATGGLARFENDDYQRVFGNYHGISWNPWIITTLWHTQWLIAIAQTKEDLQEAEKFLNWTMRHMNQAGILPEQLNPFSGEHLSVAPLTWSHAVFVETALRYKEKLQELKN